MAVGLGISQKALFPISYAFSAEYCRPRRKISRTRFCPTFFAEIENAFAAPVEPEERSTT
jgi:hypothetical protein